MRVVHRSGRSSSSGAAVPPPIARRKIEGFVLRPVKARAEVG